MQLNDWRLVRAKWFAMSYSVNNSLSIQFLKVNLLYCCVVVYSKKVFTVIDFCFCDFLLQQSSGKAGPIVGLLVYCILDINECLIGIHNCHQDATCSNTNGSFNCNCDHGFRGNGSFCIGNLWTDFKSYFKLCGVGIFICNSRLFIHLNSVFKWLYFWEALFQAFTNNEQLYIMLDPDCFAATN